MKENVSAILQGKLPTKCKDPRSFTIPCTIGNSKFENALLDLGASINVMPSSLYKKLCTKTELKTDGVTILLTDRSHVYPKGVLEDVLVQVGRFQYPADFYILDIGEAPNAQLILGRPFMCTAQTRIDMARGELSMDFDNETIKFNMFEMMRYPMDTEMCYALSTTGDVAQKYFELMKEDELETLISQGIGIDKEGNFEVIVEGSGKEETLPIIISSKLTSEQEEKVVKVVSKHMKAIGWCLANIRGISPTLCVHRIHLGEGAKHVRIPQCRLNPPMMEVVKKEVIKLLDNGIIYPMRRTSWCLKEPSLRLSFGQCNAPGTFQRCMMSIFSDYVGKIIEVFMDDFSVFGVDFDGCLINLGLILQRCEEINLVLNWEKCHFMVTQGIVLGHKDIPFEFNDKCKLAFEELKSKLTSFPILQAPDWNSPFEIMCDASDYAVGAVLGQWKGKKVHAIYYASRTLNDAQLNYATTEKELLAVVFALEKFRSYLLGTKVIVYTDHAALKYLLAKKEAKPRLIH
ncbi:uncharacterized protein LOC141665386 [Apium graveolens]|uniref:uncharacterized protein LOC141665386 n=1 Tax=Apium graveolens TaxID=4045 RepID=UPI003D7AA08C